VGIRGVGLGVDLVKPLKVSRSGIREVTLLHGGITYAMIRGERDAAE
jgi:hypothetical protein